MLHQVKLATAAQQPTRTVRGSAPLRFGKLDASQLRPYQAVIQDMPDLKKYKELSLLRSYDKLPEAQQERFEAICNDMPPQEVEAMKKKLGILEESSDMMFELFSWQALNKKLITKPAAQKLSDEHMPANTQAARDQKPFEQYISQIARLNQALTNKTKLNAFTKTMPLTPEKAKQLYMLMLAKYTLFLKRDPGLNIKKASKPLLKGEADELEELFPRFSLRRLEIKGLAIAYTYIPQLPAKLFCSLMQGLVSSILQTPVKSTDLLGLVSEKQALRQEFDYANPQYKSNEERKTVLKGWEVLNEASCLKKARLWSTSTH